MNAASKLLRIFVIFLATLGANPPACQQAKGDTDTEMDRELRKAEQMISRQEITKGEFWGIRIGNTKRDVAARLQTLGISTVSPRVKDQIVIDSPGELHRLADVEGIIALSGAVRIGFLGDAVTARNIVPNLPHNWSVRLEHAATRDVVFDILTEILREDSHPAVGSYAAGPNWVDLQTLSIEDWAILSRFDAWELNHENENGFSHLRLEFASGYLVKMVVQHSPVELP